MIGVGRVIQVLILFSAILGVFFLWQAYPLLPAVAFDFIAFGWVLFVIDSFLTFIRPRVSYLLGLLLALLALGETLSQPAHYSLVQDGNLSATVTLVTGAAAQVLIIAFVLYFFVAERRRNPWAWPGAKSQA